MNCLSSFAITLSPNSITAKGRGGTGIVAMLILVIFILGLPLILRS